MTLAPPAERSVVRSRQRVRWRPRSRLGGGPRLALLGDAVLALALAAVAVTAVATRAGVPHQTVMIVLALAQALPLAFRRQQPQWVLAVVVAASTAAAITGGTLIEPLSLLAALYTVAGRCSRPAARRAGAAAAVMLAWPLLRDSNGNLLPAVFKLGFLAVGWVFGAYLGELHARAAGNRREQQLHSARAVAEEQARVGRELHDIIAHTLSVVVVQAAAAGDVFDASPDRARQALASIETAGRQALSELRRVLGTVRPRPEESSQLTPQPGLSQLDQLIGQVRSTGLAVTLQVEGASAGLPAGIDLSAYRIIQEALTNTIKHAQATTAEVAIRYRPRELILDIVDNGHSGTPGADPGSGPSHGLIGMRERAAINGGELTAGPQPGGGFAVHARFPLLTEGP